MQPLLAVVLVGAQLESRLYVRMKSDAAQKLGIATRVVELPEDAEQGRIGAVVDTLAGDPRVHGILVQLPLPEDIDVQNITQRIPAHKDVDGLVTFNMGALATKRLDPLYSPCTPGGCMQLLRDYNVPLRGAKAVVVGRSTIVGMPMALLLLAANATVTICHRHSLELEESVRSADIVISATGVPGLIRGEWIKPGAVVMDVGISEVSEAEREAYERGVDFTAQRVSPGSAEWMAELPRWTHLWQHQRDAPAAGVYAQPLDHEVVMQEELPAEPAAKQPQPPAPVKAPRSGRTTLVGDVRLSEAMGRAALATPVPGGVGPMTIAMLMCNTVSAAEYAARGGPPRE